MKQVVWYTTIILLTLGGLLLLWQFREAAILFFLSLAVASVFRPGIEYLVGRGLPRSLALLIPYLLGLGILFGLISLASGPFLTELQKAADNFAAGYARFQSPGANIPDFLKALAGQLPQPQDLYQAITGNQGLSLAAALVGLFSNLAGLFSRLVIVIVLSIYWTADRVRFERLWLSVLPAGQRTRARDIWRGIEKGVGSYIRSELIQSILAALLLVLAYRWIGLEYPILLAVLGALAWLIPWLGAVLAVIPPFVVGFLVQPWLGVSAALITLVVLVALEVLVEPRIFNRRRYSSLLVVIMVIALSETFGLVGLIIAPPLAAAIQIFFSNLMTQPAAETPVEPATEIDQLRVQLDHVREMGAHLEEPSPAVASLMERLDKLINQTEEAVKADTHA